MFFDGALGPVRRRKPDAGKHQRECDADHGEAGLRMDDYLKPSRCSGKSSGSGCGYVSEVRRGGGKRLPGVEGAEREDLHDREVGIVILFHVGWFDSRSFDS